MCADLSSGGLLNAKDSHLKLPMSTWRVSGRPWTLSLSRLSALTFSPPKVKPFKLCSPSCYKQEQNESPEQELIDVSTSGELLQTELSE